MPEEVGGEKTLPASPLKRQRAREQGNVSKSQDLSAALELVFALIAMWYLGPPMFEALTEITRYYLASAAAFAVEPSTFQPLALDAILRMGLALLPFLALMLVGGVAVNVVQIGFLFAPQVLTPKFEKLNPITGLARFFNVRSVAELVKSVLKLAAISYVVYVTFKSRWEQLLFLPFLTPMGIVKAVGALVFALWLRIVIAMVVIGILDFGFQRWRYEQDLRMTVQEAKEEMKQFEGDPRIRQRIRAIQRQMAMQRMLREVPKAEVVITNPTTYAVALRYNMSEMDAPVVVAKGARLLALRIRELAIAHNVPIVERPELARALYRTIEVNHPVPEVLFRAVAEVLAFVFRIDTRADKLRERQETLPAAV